MLITALCGCNRSVFRGTERQLAGKSRSVSRVREPRQVRSAKKQQEKKQAKIKKDYQLFVKNSRKRSYEIQSEDVKARMKKNEANIEARDKSKARRTKSESKNRARQFR